MSPSCRQPLLLRRCGDGKHLGTVLHGELGKAAFSDLQGAKRKRRRKREPESGWMRRVGNVVPHPTGSAFRPHFLTISRGHASLVLGP